MKQSWWDWNNAIGQATFSEKQVNRVVYLAIDKDEIGRIGRKLDLDAVAAYESFRSAVIDQVRAGWPDPFHPIREGQYPHYLAALAAQVVAAFQMHDDGLTAAKAYWRRLREFLGQSSADRMPDGLKSKQHNALWKSLEKWANEINGKRLGRVQLAGKAGGHYLVAEVLGQCLLRRADLEKLRDLFAAQGQPAPEPYDERRLRELVDDARCSLPGRFFTKHSVRVLNDADRRDAAWDQIKGEYTKFLADECPAAGPIRRSRIAAVRRGRRRTTVLLQLGPRGLSGGLYRRGDGPLTSVITNVSEVLSRCYLLAGREGPKPPHKPPHEDFLLATRDGEYCPFVEKGMCRAGEDVLLLVPEVPDSCSQAWLDDADPRLFVEKPRFFRSSLSGHCPGWDALDGLPMDWLALRFRTRDDLSAVTLRGKWRRAVDRATRLRAVGGLPLRRGVWMFGAGPTIQVVGPGNYEDILVDGELHSLDASMCATLDLGPGMHRIRLPRSGSRALRFRVLKPRRNAPRELAGWQWVESGWPASARERLRIKAIAGSDTLHGATLIGNWPARDKPEPKLDVTLPRTANGAVPDELTAMILALRLRVGGRFRLADVQLLPAMSAESALGVNPLIRGMLRAGRAGIPGGTNKV
jgi:hypothetical protein